MPQNRRAHGKFGDTEDGTGAARRGKRADSLSLSLSLSLEEARKERQALRWMITVQLRGDAGAQRLTAWLPMHLVVISLNGAQIITNIFSCK